MEGGVSHRAAARRLSFARRLRKPGHGPNDDPPTPNRALGGGPGSPYNLSSLQKASLSVRENRHPAGDVEAQIPALRRYARGLAGPDQAATADQMVAEVIARAFSGDQRPQIGALRLRLFAALTSLNRSRMRAARVKAPTMTPAPRPDRPAGLREAFAQTPLEGREALLLVVVEGFSYAQAAEILGVNRLGVATRLARARRDLDARLEANRPEPAQRDPRRPPYLRLVK